MPHARHPYGDKRRGREKSSNNKRAQRALGRSPEEKVKGQGEANYIIITKYW